MIKPVKPMVKNYGVPNGKIKIFFEIKTGRFYTPCMVYRCNNVSDAARVVWSFRRARSAIKWLRGSRYLSGYGFARYSLRWLACHNCALYIIGDAGLGKLFEFTAPYLQFITVRNENR